MTHSGNDFPDAPNRTGRLLDARLHLLDRQLIDDAGEPVGIVDDLDLDGVAVGDDIARGTPAPRVSGILTGQVLATRIFGGQPPRASCNRCPGGWSPSSAPSCSCVRPTSRSTASGWNTGCATTSSAASPEGAMQLSELLGLDVLDDDRRASRHRRRRQAHRRPATSTTTPTARTCSGWWSARGPAPPTWAMNAPTPADPRCWPRCCAGATAAPSSRCGTTSAASTRRRCHFGPGFSATHRPCATTTDGRQHRRTPCQEWRAHDGGISGPW